MMYGHDRSEMNGLEMAWVPVGDHDRQVLNDMYLGYESCTQWLVIETESTVDIILCAEDKSSPDDTPFTRFHKEDGMVDFRDVVDQLRDDEYYEDVE